MRLRLCCRRRGVRWGWEWMRRGRVLPPLLLLGWVS